MDLSIYLMDKTRILTSAITGFILNKIKKYFSFFLCCRPLHLHSEKKFFSNEVATLTMSCFFRSLFLTEPVRTFKYGCNVDASNDAPGGHIERKSSAINLAICSLLIENVSVGLESSLALKACFFFRVL